MQISRQWLSHCDTFLLVCCLAARYRDVQPGVVPHADVFAPHADGRSVLPGVPQAVSIRGAELRRRGDVQSPQRPLPGVPLSPGPCSVQAPHVSADAVQAPAQRGLLSCVQRWVFYLFLPFNHHPCLLLLLLLLFIVQQSSCSVVFLSLIHI